MDAAAGSVVIEMNTPIRALARDSVSETTPATPAGRTAARRRPGGGLRSEAPPGCAHPARRAARSPAAASAPAGSPRAHGATAPPPVSLRAGLHAAFGEPACPGGAPGGGLGVRALLVRVRLRECRN